MNTEWAAGAAAEWATLTFQPWQHWHQSNPPSTIGVDAVVHLITGDIYIDIRFASWVSGGMGGGFSYYRADGPASPAGSASWSSIKALYR